MGLRFTRYMKLSANALHKTLTDQGVSPHRMQEIKTVVDEQKAARRKYAAHKRQMDLHWGELLAPLVHERKVVKSILRYKASPERTEALEAYLLVLTTLLDKLNWMRIEKDQTPASLHPDRTHWTDYVPQRIKNEVCVMFDAIPHKAKAKVKLPFQRTVPMVLHAKQKARLEKRTIKELGVAEQDYLLDPSEKNAQVVERIKGALKKIRVLSPTEAVPVTWYGVENEHG